MLKCYHVNIIIVTGISGINKSEFIQNFVKKAGIAAKSKIIKFETELTNRSRQSPGIIPPSDITSFLEESSRNKIKTIEETFSWITDNLLIDSNIEYVFLEIHLQYYKNTEYFPPFNPAHFIGWIDSIDHDANVKIINLIDDVFNIWQVLKEREKIYPNTQLTLREILGWRSLETLQSESLASSISALGAGRKLAQPYMVSIRHPLSTFKNLIIPKTPISIYLSYPISKTRHNKKDVLEINKFRKKVHSLGQKHSVTVFDPVTIDELILKQASHTTSSPIKLDKSMRWPLDFNEPVISNNNSVVKLKKTEIKDSIDHITHQVKSRDLKLVDQAALLVVYRPFFDGQPSQGALAEIRHGKNNGVGMCIYSPRSDKIPQSDNPFDSNITPIINMSDFYHTIEAKLTELKKRHNNAIN